MTPECSYPGQNQAVVLVFASFLSLRGAAAFSALRIVGAGAGFATQVILAHLLSASDLGIFFSATSLAVVAGLIAAQGYPEIATRFLARYRRREGSPLPAIFIRQAFADARRAALAIALAIVAGALLWPSLSHDTRLAFATAGLSVLAITSLSLFSSVAGAMRWFGLCYVPESLGRPAVFLTVIGGLALLGVQLSAGLVTAIFIVVTGIIAGVQYAMMRGSLPELRGERARSSLSRLWRAEARPLIVFALFTNLFADIGILCVTPFMTSADVAVFGLCLKLALLVGFVIQVTQRLALADMADARLDRNPQAMRDIVRRSVLLPVAATLLAAVLAAIAGGTLLAYFGPHFVRGQDALLILLGSQFLRAIAGPSAHVVTLAGAQRLNAGICAGALVVLLGANMLLTPEYGLTGAALSVFLTYSFWIAATALGLRQLREARTDILSLLPARLSPARKA